MSPQRQECETELALALARYVGYTTGAYNIRRIAGLTSKFQEKASLYSVELEQSLKQEFSVSSRYASGVVNFGVGLGLLSRLVQGGKLARLAITPLGRAYRAATGLESKQFASFLLVFSLLQFDADVYGLVLDMAAAGPLPRGRELHSLFLDRTRLLREERRKWLRLAFQNDYLRKRIVDVVHERRSWSAATFDSDIKEDFARHHSAPRRGWAEDLGHLDSQGYLTDEGLQLLAQLRAEGERYFWLGPPEECFSALRLPESSRLAPYGPAWNLLRPKTEAKDIPRALVERVSQFMKSGFCYLRLIRANQAPLDSVRPYLYFCERERGEQVDEGSFFRALFAKHRDLFAPMSTRTAQLGHYQLRRHS